MNWYSIFYWLTIADNVKTITGTLSVVFGIYTLCACCAALGMFDSSFSEWEKGTKKVFYIFTIAFLINILLWGFLPSKKDSLMIIAGGGALTFLTTDSSAKKLPPEVMNYLVTNIRKYSKEAEVDLLKADNKEEILNQAKNMSANELLEKMKVDSSFRKIILEN